jgi:hypothetical protein
MSGLQDTASSTPKSPPFELLQNVRMLVVALIVDNCIACPESMSGPRFYQYAAIQTSVIIVILN